MKDRQLSGLETLLLSLPLCFCHPYLGHRILMFGVNSIDFTSGEVLVQNPEMTFHTFSRFELK